MNSILGNSLSVQTGDQIAIVRGNGEGYATIASLQSILTGGTATVSASSIDWLNIGTTLTPADAAAIASFIQTAIDANQIPFSNALFSSTDVEAAITEAMVAANNAADNALASNIVVAPSTPFTATTLDALLAEIMAATQIVIVSPDTGNLIVPDATGAALFTQMDMMAAYDAGLLTMAQLGDMITALQSSPAWAPAVAVAAAAGGLASSGVDNDSSVPGATVSAALDNLQANMTDVSAIASAVVGNDVNWSVTEGGTTLTTSLPAQDIIDALPDGAIPPRLLAPGTDTNTTNASIAFTATHVTVTDSDGNAIRTPLSGLILPASQITVVTPTGMSGADAQALFDEIAGDLDAIAAAQAALVQATVAPGPNPGEVEITDANGNSVVTMEAAAINAAIASAGGSVALNNIGTGQALTPASGTDVYGLVGVNGVTVTLSGADVEVGYDPSAMTAADQAAFQAALAAMGVDMAPDSFASAQGSIVNVGTADGLDLDIDASVAMGMFAAFAAANPSDPNVTSFNSQVAEGADTDTDTRLVPTLIGAPTSTLRLELFAVDPATGNVTGSALATTNVPLSGGAVANTYLSPNNTISIGTATAGQVDLDIDGSGLAAYIAANPTDPGVQAMVAAINSDTDTRTVTSWVDTDSDTNPDTIRVETFAVDVATGATTGPALSTTDISAADILAAAGGAGGSITVVSIGTGQQVYAGNNAGTEEFRSILGIAGVSTQVNTGNIEVKFDSSSLPAGELAALAAAIGGEPSAVAALQPAIDTDDQDASEVPVTPPSGYTGTTAQALFDEIVAALPSVADVSNDGGGLHSVADGAGDTFQTYDVAAINSREPWRESFTGNAATPSSSRIYAEQNIGIGAGATNPVFPVSVVDTVDGDSQLVSVQNLSSVAIADTRAGLRMATANGQWRIEAVRTGGMRISTAQTGGEDLFTFTNDGKFSIGSTTPSTKFAVAGLTQANTAPRVLVSDLNGNIFYADASSFGGSGATPSGTAPASPFIGQLWLDTSASPNVTNIYAADADGAGNPGWQVLS